MNFITPSVFILIRQINDDDDDDDDDYDDVPLDGVAFLRLD